MMEIKRTIESGEAVLGIELGSTRIKAVLIGKDHAPIASGSHDWENKLTDGVWTYSLKDVWTGVQNAYKELLLDVREKYDVTINKLAAIGFSAMMHGYLVLDKNGNQLVPFRTWRNTTTEVAAKQLTELFKFNVPQRWSIAHLQQAVLNNEEHVKNIDLITTLAGYIHWKLSGEKVMGVGEASGMFPIDSTINNFNEKMLAQYDLLVSDKNFSWEIKRILPRVLVAGEAAGNLTDEGAKLIDPTGRLKPGISMCPPEGDAGTGMVATNSIAVSTGNISAGTSIFAMAVLEKELSKVYPEIDMVTTPTGKPVAMVHCNNCTSDLDTWVQLFRELNPKLSKPELYDMLYIKALEGDDDCGGILSYNYVSGEPITGLEAGRPLLIRMPNSRFTLANFMRAQLFATMGTLKIGMDILFKKENVTLEKLYGHGGLFKTKIVGQRLMAAAMNTPVAVMETAGEGGAWGIAILAAYSVFKKNNEPLEIYLSETVFAENIGISIEPIAADVQGFSKYMKNYIAGLIVEKAAVESLK